MKMGITRANFKRDLHHGIKGRDAPSREIRAGKENKPVNPCGQSLGPRQKLLAPTVVVSLCGADQSPFA
jgi:hypothetical protein